MSQTNASQEQPTWEVVRLIYPHKWGGDEVAKYLKDGWEPFAATDNVIYLRRVKP